MLRILAIPIFSLFLVYGLLYAVSTIVTMVRFDPPLHFTDILRGIISLGIGIGGIMFINKKFPQKKIEEMGSDAPPSRILIYQRVMMGSMFFAFSPLFAGIILSFFLNDEEMQGASAYAFLGIITIPAGAVVASIASGLLERAQRSVSAHK